MSLHEDFLKASGNALSFREGAEWYAVSPLHRSGKSLAQLDAASQGAAGAQAVVTLNVEGLEYTVDRSGLVRYSAPEPSVASVPSLLEKLAQTVDAIPGGRAAADLRRLANSALASSAAFDPTVTLTLNKREVAAIASSKGIRDIRLASEGDVRPFAAPFNVIADAETHGYVDVIVTMRQSVPQGNLSASSTLAHWKSVEASMDAVRADLGGLRSLKNLPAVDSMVGRVSRDELKALAASRDMRLANVSGSGVVGQPALEVSNAFLNMPLVWNSSGPNGLVSGAGAKVVVMDTGVQSIHTFLRGLPSGNTRVTRQRCFGTTDASKGYTSLCPSPQDVSFNSSAPNSGEAYTTTCPYSISPTCSHGTSVAGVAAGGSVSNPPLYYTKQSMAYAADIWAYSIYSKIDTLARLVNIDLLEALHDVLFATAIGSTANPIVVNLSTSNKNYSKVCSGGSSEVADDEKAAYDSVQYAIDSLFSRGVAVVASTGNDASVGYIGFPACLAKVVKVGAVPNDNVGTKTVQQTNLPDPAKFPGDFIWMVPGGGLVRGSSTPTTLLMPKATSPYGLAWDTNSGTSFAAPHVSGLFALYKSFSPAAPVTEIGNYLNGTGRSYDVSGMASPTAVYNTYKGIKFISVF